MAEQPGQTAQNNAAEPNVDPKVMASVEGLLERTVSPVLPEPAAPKPIEPAAPKFSYDAMISARQAGYSEDEIKSFSSEHLLRDAVSGRRAIAEAEIAARERAAQERQPKPQPIREFKLEIPDEVDDPSTLVPHVRSLAAEVQVLHRELAAERSARAQSDERWNQVHHQMNQRAIQDAVNTLESVVSTIPELSSRLGRLSDVSNQPGSEQHLRWQMIAPAVQAQLNGKPLTVENIKSALLESARVLGWMTREVNTGNGKAPGHVFGSASRTPKEPVVPQGEGMNERERMIGVVRGLMGGVV